MTAARRLAAILAVDFMGYSRLMGEDEAVTARRFANIARRKMFPTRSL
jgi:class 3 adenylate cyclase